MQLRSIYFAVLILVGSIMSLASIHALGVYDEDKYDMYEEEDDEEEEDDDDEEDEDNHDTKNWFPRLSRKQAKQISHLMLGTAFVIYFTFARKQPSILKIEYGAIMNYRVPLSMPRAKLDPNGKIVEFANKRVFFTNYDLRDATLLTNKLKCDAKNVLFLNAANKELKYHKGGINNALSIQNDELLKKKGKKAPHGEDTKYWGDMTNHEGKKWPKKQDLKIAQEYTISKHPITNLNVVHIAGPNFNKTEEIKYFPFLKNTIKQMLEDNISKYKVIVLCTISTAIFARNDNDKRIALKAIVEAVEEVLAQYKQPKDLKTKIVCNNWDYNFSKRMTEGNLDRSGYFSNDITGPLPS